jgi:hypothetical protein
MPTRSMIATTTTGGVDRHALPQSRGTLRMGNDRGHGIARRSATSLVMVQGPRAAMAGQGTALGSADERTAMKKQMTSVNTVATPVLVVDRGLVLVEGGAAAGDGPHDIKDLNQDGTVEYEEQDKFDAMRSREATVFLPVADRPKFAGRGKQRPGG